MNNQHLTGCAVLPPLDEPLKRRPTRHRDTDHDGDRGADSGKATNKTTDKASSTKRKTGDRFRVLNNFADFTLRTLTRTEAAVWLLLWRDTKSDGLARTGQSDLAKRAGVTRRAVTAAIGQLERRGLLVVVERGRLQSGPSTYRVQSLDKERAL